MVAGFFIALVVGVAIIIAGCYRYGYFGLGMGSAYGWPSWQTRNDGGRIFEYLNNPAPVDGNGIVAIGAGAAVALLLGTMRLRFWWWPFHPIGFVMGTYGGLAEFWFSVFLGWMVKAIIMRFFGVKSHRRAAPFFLGLVLGDYVVSSAWTLIGMIFHFPTYVLWTP